MPLEAEPMDDNFDESIDCDNYDYLYDVLIETLDLSQDCYNAMRRTGITTVGDCIDAVNRIPDVMFAARSNFLTCLPSEVKDKLIKHGYGAYLRDA